MKTTVAFAVAAVLAAALPAQAQYPYYDSRGNPAPYNMAPPPIADHMHSYETNVPDPYRRAQQERLQQQQQQDRQRQDFGPNNPYLTPYNPYR